MKAYQLGSLVLALLVALSAFGVASAQSGAENSLFLPNIGGGNLAGSSTNDEDVDGVEVASTVQITLKDSAGSPLSGGIVRIGTSGWPRCPGVTDTDGIISCTLPKNSVSIRMEYNNTTATQTKAELDASAYTFSTVEAIIQLKDSAGSLIDGGEVRFGTSGWPVIGHTGNAGSGTVAFQVFPGTYNFRMAYNYGSEQKSHNVGSGPLIFQTGLVDLQFSGVIQHGVGGWPAYGGPTEMLPIEHRFGFSGPGYPRRELRFTPTPGAVLQQSIYYVRLRNSTGVGVAGGEARQGGGWPLMGVTSADGTLLYSRPGKDGNVEVRMDAPNYGGSQTSPSQYHPTNSFFDFQTSGLVIQLLSHNGTPLDGGKVRTAGGWPVIGTTGDGGPGIVMHERFPGTYNYRLDYNYGTEQKSHVVGSGPLVFQTGLVDVQFSGTVAHGVSGWPAYNRPTEMLPVEHRFAFSGPGYSRQELQFTPTAGAVFQRSVVYLKLLNSTGGGLMGGVAKWADGSWHAIPGTTDANGILLYAIEGIKGNVKVSMSWNQGSVEITQHQPSNSFYLYQTVEATIRLIDDSGVGIPGGKVDQGGGYWQEHGITDGNGEFKLQMFPGNYKFRMGVNYTTQEKIQDIATPIVFQTGKVTWDGTTSPAPTQASLSGGWRTFVNNWQLLPGTYTFQFDNAPSQPVTVDAAMTTQVP